MHTILLSSRFDIVHAILIYAILLFTLHSISPRKHTNCCLRGANICSCPKLTLNGLQIEPCNQSVTGRKLKNNSLQVQLHGTVKPGNYTVFAIAPDETFIIQRPDLAWVVFAAINIPESCLISSCSIILMYPPQIGGCVDLFDFETRLFVFAMRQRRAIQQSDLTPDALVQTGSKASNFKHLIYYNRFYDRRLFDGAPTHANQYRLVKCDPKDILHDLTQDMQRVHNFDQIERYFYRPSPTFEPHRNLELMYMHLPMVTQFMIYQEKINCGTHREMTGGEARDSLHPKMTHCAMNVLDTFLAQVRQDLSIREHILDHWKKLTDVWIQAWQYEMYIMQWMSEIAGDYTGARENYNMRVSKHYLLDSGAQAYWVALYRATRIVCKLQLYGDVIFNVTGEWPKYQF